MKINKWVIILAGSIILVFTYFYFGNVQMKWSTFGPGFKNRLYLSRAKGEVDNFGLLDHTGVFRELYRDSDAKAIVFIAHRLNSRSLLNNLNLINKWANEYEQKGIVFYFINSSITDTRQEIISEAKKLNFKIPVLVDSSQVVSKMLRMKNIGEIIGVSPKTWSIVFRGNNKQEMEMFLEGALSGNFVKHDGALKDSSEPIHYEKNISIDYSKDIAPLFIKKCLTCHSAAGGFPPAFSDYEKIISWSEMIKETIMTERMPPWSSDPHYGPYANDLSLSPFEKRTLIEWLNQGAIKKSESDPILAWNLKSQYLSPPESKLRPIFKLQYTEKNIPPGGLIEYRYPQLLGPTTEDIWLRGTKTTSSNGRQIHHEALMITTKPVSFFENLAKQRALSRKKDIYIDYENGVVPLFILREIINYETKFSPDSYLRFQIMTGGIKQPMIYKPNIVIFIPKGSYIIMESHYMGTGRTEDETTTIEFYGTKERPKYAKQLRRFFLAAHDLVVPPMTKSHSVVTKSHKINQDIDLINFNVHLHMRGVAAKLEMRPPGGEFRTIMSIPNYAYGWANGSLLALQEPLAVKKGTEFRGVCNYNNSPQNQFNPDPTKTLYFGQRLDRSEMCVFHVLYTNSKEKILK